MLPHIHVLQKFFSNADRPDPVVQQGDVHARTELNLDGKNIYYIHYINN